MGFSSGILITRRGSSGVIRLELTQTIVPSSIRTQARASSWSLPRPFLRLELVQRRPYGGRAYPLGAAVHIFDAAAPHHPVFAGANPEAPHVLADVPVLLPPTPGVSLRRVRQDRKSTRLNSSHGYISYAVFCLKK